VNFTTAGTEIYDKIKERIQGKEIGILVNNVGMAQASPDYFLSMPDREKFIQDLIQCNIMSVPMMCSVVMPQMVQRKKGLIINISSLSALVPTPLMSVYAATKAFVHKFSEDLSKEYENQGIVVQSVLPGPVATNMTKLKKGSWMAPKANVYVESVIQKVGIAFYAVGYYPHIILQQVTNFLNFVAPTFLIKTTIKTMTNIRNRAIKKGLYTPVTAE
jgi:17beta-estradiol 17-dehydrogenase / very-long-chain 3-oxoacyl-CoA reductase